jgi:hypothetical protein
MKKGLIGVASIVLLILVIGGSVVWFYHKFTNDAVARLGPSVDFKDREMAASFKKSYSDNCVTTFQKDAAQSAETPTDDQLIQVRSACGCIADQTIADLAKRSPMTAFELAATLTSDREIPGVKGCAAKLP